MSTDPNRPLQVGIVFGIAALIWLILRIFIAGIATQ